jgi:hypothetical protein
VDDQQQAARPSSEARTVVSLSVGARVCLLLGALLLVLAGLLFWGPISHEVSNGFPAKCGSAAKPPKDSLGKAVCGNANAVRRAESIAALVGAGVLVGGGLLLFGFTRVPSRHARYQV